MEFVFTKKCNEHDILLTSSCYLKRQVRLKRLKYHARKGAEKTEGTSTMVEAVLLKAAFLILGKAPRERHLMATQSCGDG